MSVQFHTDTRCNCVDRWATDPDPVPDPRAYSCDICNLEMNLNNRNAADLLAWLGLDTGDLYGSAPARDIAARCRRRLWDVPRNHDSELPERQLSERAIESGRAPGYLREKTEMLLKLAESAGDGEIQWD